MARSNVYIVHVVRSNVYSVRSLVRDRLEDPIWPL